MSATLDRPASAGSVAVRSAPHLDFDRSNTGYGINPAGNEAPISLTDDEPSYPYLLAVRSALGTATGTGGGTLDFRGYDAWFSSMMRQELRTEASSLLSVTCPSWATLGCRLVSLEQSLSIVLPESLGHLVDEINASRSMLELEDDWDGEGSLGYDSPTWWRAIQFLLRNALQLWREREAVIPTPRIRKGPQGSIDLHWHTSNRELLINIPATLGEVADYYGDDGAGGHQMRGALNPERQGRDLVLWLVT